MCVESGFILAIELVSERLCVIYVMSKFRAGGELDEFVFGGELCCSGQKAINNIFLNSRSSSSLLSLSQIRVGFSLLSPNFQLW